MTSALQMSLFEPEPPARHDCVHDGPCATCGAMRPYDHTRYMWLEPVSGECGDCNGRTLDQLMEAFRTGNRALHDSAWKRHYPPGRVASQQATERTS